MGPECGVAGTLTCKMIHLLYYEAQQPSLVTGLSLKLNSIIAMSENQKKDGNKPIKVNLTGKRFGRWTVREEGEPRIRINGKKRRRWICDCDCGESGLVDQANLLRGGSLSCGCLKTETTIKRCTTHGCATHGAPSAEYRAWQAMINRCTNKDYVKYNLYGGRGIKVCKRWMDRFENFLEDMGPRPTDKQTLDRKDSNGNYEPSNCRWATWLDQQNNRNNNRMIEWKGRTQTVSQWARELGFDPPVIFNRLNLGWDLERVFTIPKGPSHR